MYICEKPSISNKIFVIYKFSLKLYNILIVIFYIFKILLTIIILNKLHKFIICYNLIISFSLKLKLNLLKLVILIKYYYVLFFDSFLK